MSAIAGALNIAILARLRGTEVLTGDQLTAQGVTNAVPWRLGTMRKNGALPAGTFYEDAGIDAFPAAPDVGILQYSIRRFEFWKAGTDDTFFSGMQNALELLFDERRGAPALTLTGDGKVYESALFVGMQGPIPDDDINANVGLMSFRFVEARPY